ncbi:MAG: 30S ribosomal protein S4 [Candidatus Kapaibacterium sp.]
MNYTGPKVKLSRKVGINMTPKAQKYAAKKPYPPGQHGNSRRRGKMSDFGRQLIEKQRLRLQYNISESQMLKYYKEASRLTGNTGDLLVQLMEARLDALVFRAGLSRSMYAARQYVRHGHVLVNGKKVDIPSYVVQVNDRVEIKEKSRKTECFQEAIRSAAPPPYLELSKADFSFKYLYTPDREEVPVQCEVPLVIEFYSR